MTAPMDIRAARATIDSVITHITAARRALGEGHAVSLAPLQEITRQACRDVAALPAEDRRGLRSLLEAVLYDLDTLAADLTARYGTLVRRADHGGHRPPTVGDAYRRSDLLAAGRRPSAAAGEEEAPPLGSGPSGEAS
ncbi:hypothetical protein ACM64Y_11650 [Novispirillum sp. DQ9]|uniref:hypothetical protein n=1 Tax=Novispirillum sp. DQ9 TaxID=3398612 RepID=UPI003C7ED5AD